MKQELKEIEEEKMNKEFTLEELGRAIAGYRI